MVGLIYKITNNCNDKVYIGQTWRSLVVRLSEHKRPSCINCIKLVNAFNKYGRDNFNIERLTICYIQETLDFYETLFIKKYNSINNGYNIKTGGRGGLHSEATKKKISDAKKGKYKGEKSHRYGKKMSLETKIKISNAKMGQRCSPATEFKKGDKPSDETRNRMSESRRGHKNHFYGKIHSKKTKEKISRALIGRYKGEKSPCAKINQQIADMIRNKYRDGMSAKWLMNEFGVSKTQIYGIIRNERWPTNRTI